jgi:hypothetical protein
MEIAVATLGNFHAKPFGHGKAGQANVSQTPSAPEENKQLIIYSIKIPLF